MRAGGYWIDKSYDEFLQLNVARAPDKVALLAYRGDRAEGRRFTCAELGDLIARAAASLRRLGIGPDDIVSVQLPNWWEFAVVTLAAFRIGAVVNPLMPIFRERELSYMLEFAGSKALVVPKTFRGFDHEAMAYALKPNLPKLQNILVVDGAGPNSFETALLSAEERLGPPPVGDIGPLEGDAMAVLMFTSGTTGSPKGVMHCLNTLMACNVALAERFGLDETDTMLVCSPLGHMTGFAAGMLLGLKIGATVVFQDVWEPKRGVSIMAEDNVTFSAGAATFLTDMCEAVIHGAPKPRSLRKFLCAGAPIPPALIERVHRELGAVVCSLWGMTESLSSTLTEPERALLKSSTSDGRELNGVGVKVVRLDGTPAPVGETGALKVRGAQMALGYYKRPEMEPFDAEGWFDTGDLAYMDEEGYIRINGRLKDIIIRGGENVPIVEIEGLLFKHPAVLAAALVGYPDARLGERACAFPDVAPRPQPRPSGGAGLHGGAQGRQAILARAHRDRRGTAEDSRRQNPEVPVARTGQGVRRRPRESERLSGRLKGRVCVVTGAARGIGLAIAERFGEEGARLACVDVSAKRLEPAVAELRAKSYEVRGYAVDVAAREDVWAMFARIEAEFAAPVAVLVNNAVWARFQPLAEIDAETMARMFGVGVNGLIWTMQAAVPQMERRGGGAIVNLSSVSAFHPAKDSVAYSALKAGVVGLSRAAAAELSAKKIRVNVVAPGMIGTPASIAQFNEATLAARQAEMPLGRFGEPQEIAALAAFLASDDASYLQGAVITADGGWTVPAR